MCDPSRVKDLRSPRQKPVLDPLLGVPDVGLIREKAEGFLRIVDLFLTNKN
jgi:hypothetical protein